MALKAHAALVTAMLRFLDLRADKDVADPPRAGVLNKVGRVLAFRRRSATLHGSSS